MNAVDSQCRLFYPSVNTVKRFEFIEHTADIGVRVWGVTLTELFSNAAFAMFSIVAELSGVREASNHLIEVTSRNREELLVEWLRELLYVSDVRRYLFSRFDLVEMDETRLKAVCWGESIDPARHLLRTEVKTVTYHQLYIRESPGGLEAQVIFDI